MRAVAYHAQSSASDRQQCARPTRHSNVAADMSGALFHLPREGREGNVNDKTIMQVIKYRNGDERCKCSGQIMYDGEGWYELPLGFGFHRGDRKFYVDRVRFSGWIGNCLKCNKRTISYKSKKLISRAPKSINRKLAQKTALQTILS